MHAKLRFSQHRSTAQNQKDEAGNTALRSKRASAFPAASASMVALNLAAASTYQAGPQAYVSS